MAVVVAGEGGERGRERRENGRRVEGPKGREGGREGASQAPSKGGRRGLRRTRVLP